MKVFKMEGGMQFAELLKLEHEGKMYTYAVCLDGQPNFIFLQAGKEKGTASFVEDAKILAVLIEKTKHYVEEQLSGLIERTNKETDKISTTSSKEKFNKDSK